MAGSSQACLGWLVKRFGQREAQIAPGSRYNVSPGSLSHGTRTTEDELDSPISGVSAVVSLPRQVVSMEEAALGKIVAENIKK